MHVVDMMPHGIILFYVETYWFQFFVYHFFNTNQIWTIWGGKFVCVIFLYQQEVIPFCNHVW